MLQCTKQETSKKNISTFQENKTQESFQNLIEYSLSGVQGIKENLYNK